MKHTVSLVRGDPSGARMRELGYVAKKEEDLGEAIAFALTKAIESGRGVEVVRRWA